MKPATNDYQLALRRAMLRFGRPKRLSLDHDSAFYDNKSASPYPSRLQLWTIALGIEVVFIHKGRPTEHGFIERTHQVVDGQALLGREFADPAAIQPALEQRLDFLNTQYPSRALAGQPPLAAYPTAVHSGRPYQPEYEEDTPGSGPGVSLLGSAALVSPSVYAGWSVHPGRLPLRTRQALGQSGDRDYLRSPDAGVRLPLRRWPSHPATPGARA